MRRSQPFHLVSLCILSLTILHPVFAIPLRSAKHVPDHWAQLLEADRYSLIPSESWTTQSDIPASPTNRTSQLSYNLNPTARTKKFKGKGANSNFECHVHNAPPNINIQRVITKVVSICEQSWKSPQLVLMQVRFADLGVQENLANGGGTFFVRMKDTFNTVLPVAAAEAIRGRDLNGKKNGDGKYDVLVTVNTKTPWYDGDDGNVPNNQYDLVTVILHEVYHNVLFAGSIVAEVKRGDQYPGGVLQTASIYKDYRTRFDSFLVTRGGCPVLGYLSDQQLATDLGRSTNQLLADAVCNNQLYWGFNNRLIAKLHSPRVFMRKSSIYHFDPDHSKEEDSLMFPTVKIGIPQHIVGPTIIVMQQATLNPKILGANTACTKLPNPVPQTVPQQSDFEDPTLHAGFLVPPGLIVAEEGSVGGFPTWGIILLAILAFLLALLLLALCLMLCLRKRKNFSFTSPTSFFSSSRRGKTTSRSSSSYRSRHGHTTSATSKTSLSDFWGRSKKSSTKKSKRPATTTTTSHRPSKAKSSKDSYCKQTCPSSGKCIDKCYCVFCKPVTPPPPVASVHHYDADAPATRKCKHKCRKHCSHKSSRRSCSHKRTHSCEKSIKKTCKPTTVVCCKCYCCKYEPSTCKTSSRCCKSSSKSSSARPSSSSCPPSKKKTSSSSCKRLPPSTKPPSTKQTSVKQSSTKPSSCKPTTTSGCRTCKKSCRTCKPSGNRCACRTCNMVEINIC